MKDLWQVKIAAHQCWLLYTKPKSLVSQSHSAESSINPCHWGGLLPQNTYNPAKEIRCRHILLLGRHWAEVEGRPKYALGVFTEFQEFSLKEWDH